MLTSPHRRLAQFLAQMETSASITTGQFGEFRLGSHFQPIFSLSHAGVVGHEALLRARDSQDQPVAPPAVFQSCPDAETLSYCDSLSRMVHISNFSVSRPALQWLFLNVHPDVFLQLAQQFDDGDSYLKEVLRHFDVTGPTLVLEVLENAEPDLRPLEEAMGTVRSLGCLVAIDDFGAGHSNFDRVWRLQPDIVKIDRSLVTRAARERQAQRVVAQMVSLLHECGTLVLLEGVETLDEALLALDCDADLVQGYFFGRPQPKLCPSGIPHASITQLYDGLHRRRTHWRQSHRSRLTPFRDAIGQAGLLMSTGVSLAEACAEFLTLPDAEMCYLLDADGYQIGSDLRSPQQAHTVQAAYAPLQSGEGACWARRPYFRRAIDALGKVQITRPYRTLHGSHTCVTVSYAFVHERLGERCVRVVCGDLIWSDSAAPVSAP